MSNYVLKIVTIDFSDLENKTLLDEDLDQFSNYFQYIGCNFNVLNFNYFNLEIKFQIWNLSPRFDSILDFYLIGSMGAVIIFDHNNINSFMNTMNFIQKLSNLKRNNNVPVTLVGINALLTNDKSNDPVEQIQEIINQFLNPQENGLKLRYIPIDGDINLITEKIFFYFVDNYIIRNDIEIQEEFINRKHLRVKILENRIRISNLSNNKNTHGVSCFMDKIKVNIENINEWVICESCSIYICPSCIEYLVNEDYYYCPGSIFSKKHELIPLTIMQ